MLMWVSNRWGRSWRPLLAADNRMWIHGQLLLLRMLS